MECKHLTVDVIDVAGTSGNLKVSFFGRRLIMKNRFTLTPTQFTPSTKHARAFQKILNIQKIIKEATDVASKVFGDSSGTACRIQGTAEVNKVAGNLHITALGHGYAGEHVQHEAINFTHSITTLSFGREYPGIINPLDDVTEVTNSCTCGERANEHSVCHVSVLCVHRPNDLRR
jgi:hypothetical protein